MSAALLDNATLTGIQRVIGTAPSRSRESVDVDLLAYENYVQARLFYDDVVVIDDYIPKHQSQREMEFPVVKFINSADLHIQEISKIATEIASATRPQIKGGDFADGDTRALFDLLQTHMVCTWDVASSVYHLNLKVLAENGSEEFDKYGAVAIAIFQELNEASSSGTRPSSKVELVDRYGNAITDGYTVPGARWGSGESGAPSGAITAFVAALRWLSNRAIFYTLVSAHIKADSFLYPIRQAYQQHYLAQALRLDQNFPKRLVTQLSSALSRDILEIQNGGALAAGAIDLPVFSAWLVNKHRDSLGALDELESLRKHQDFIDAREQLAELRTFYDDNSLIKANRAAAKIGDGLKRISTRMRQKYSVQTNQGVPTTRLVTVYNAFAALQGFPLMPKIDMRVKIPQFLQDMRREIGFSSIYRNAINDLATFARLGNIRDVLGRRVHIDPNAHAYNPKAEPPEYRHRHSPFKSPM